MEIVELPRKEILADEEFNCRGRIHPGSVYELVNSIKNDGLQNPIHVQPWNKDGYKYRIIAGHRRFMACTVLNFEKVPAIIQDMNELQARVFNLTENLAREELNIMQEAKALMGIKALGIGREACAKHIGKTASWVNIRFKLLELPEEIQKEAAARVINQGQIMQLSRLRDKDKQFEAVKRIKDALIKGEKISYVGTPVAKPATTKMQRKTHHINAMLEYIADSIGVGLFTRTLAWAAGNISDYELYCDLKNYAMEKGIDYDLPPENAPSPYMENYSG